MKYQAKARSEVNKKFFICGSKFEKNYVTETITLGVFKSNEIKVGATLISVREENSKIRKK